MIGLDIFGDLPRKVSRNIIVTEIRHHSKASEAYIDAIFVLEDGKEKSVSVPTNYRRTGVDAQTAEECIKILETAYVSLSGKNVKKWLAEADSFWVKGGKKVTEPFFNVLKKKLVEWVCQGCELPPNPNWARRTQDIKEMGYTISTHTKIYCKRCESNKTHLMLLPLPRGSATGYETWSPHLRAKILRTLACYDAYENCTRPSTSLLPDHKFPEIRWDADTREENSDEMTTDEIKAKFQLLTNQRNQQKREVCRACFQSNIRGKPFGLNFYYEGSEVWPTEITKIGVASERGCVGCGWYDLAEWRDSLNKFLSSPPL